MKKKQSEVIYTKTFNYRYSVGNLLDVYVSGDHSKKTKQIIANAAEYYASLLLPKKIIKNISLNVVLKRKMDDDASGYCVMLDKDRNYKEFEIELDKKVNINEILKNLAHEMVHLKQYALGELSDGFIHARATRWQSGHFDDQKIDYWDQPWEIEAYGRELGLYSRFTETFGMD